MNTRAKARNEESGVRSPTSPSGAYCSSIEDMSDRRAAAFELARTRSLP
jgi:hypothetical protein